MRKHSPLQSILSLPYTFTDVLFSEGVLGPQPSPSITLTKTSVTCKPLRDRRGLRPQTSSAVPVVFSFEARNPKTLGSENTWCPGKSEATQQAPQADSK